MTRKIKYLYIPIPFFVPPKKNIFLGKGVVITSKKFSFLYDDTGAERESNIREIYSFKVFEFMSYIKFGYRNGKATRDPSITVIQTKADNMDLAEALFYLLILAAKHWKYVIKRAGIIHKVGLKNYQKAPRYTLSDKRIGKLKQRLIIISRTKNITKKFLISCKSWYPSLDKRDKADKIIGCLISLEAIHSNINGSLGHSIASAFYLNKRSVAKIIFNSYKARNAILHGSNFESKLKTVDEIKLINCVTEVINKYSKDTTNTFNSDSIVDNL